MAFVANNICAIGILALVSPKIGIIGIMASASMGIAPSIYFLYFGNQSLPFDPCNVTMTISIPNLDAGHWSIHHDDGL